MANSPKRMEDESSSSDEENDRLKEALDPNMFTKNTSVNRESTKSLKTTSYKDNILNVTPEFQSYVGKHLSDMIDKNIKEHNGKQFEIDTSRTGGIKLFSVSSEILTDENFSEYSYPKVNQNAKIKRKLPKKCEDDIMTEMEKIRSVAVSPEWVLEKHGVEGWSKPKGEEIEYKKNAAGNLEIVASPFVSKQSELFFHYLICR